MTTRILTIFFLLTFGLTKAQYVSTVFLDTIDITVNNKKIYSSSETILKFIPNNNDIKVAVYNDGVHKLVITFALSKSNGYSSLVLSNVHFFYNDTIYPLTRIQLDGNYYEQCSETFIERSSLQNWYYNKDIPAEKTQVKLYYRLINFAPIDTANYKYNYRQGKWIGRHYDAKEVTVNYQNDKKHGIAKALYNDGVSYNVNFHNNIADNYGQGFWENYRDGSKLKFSYTIPSILSTCDSLKSNNYTSFYFLRSKKSIEVLRHRDLSVHFEKKGVRNDSIEYHVRGDFMAINNDSIIIQSEDIDIHDFYKKNTDSLHYLVKSIPTGFAKVPLKDISKIYYERSDWKTFTLRATLVSLASALIISPIISIQKGGFNGDRFSKVTTASLGVAVLSVSFGIAFSQKEILIKPTKKSNKTWTIKPIDY